LASTKHAKMDVKIQTGPAAAVTGENADRPRAAPAPQDSSGPVGVAYTAERDDRHPMVRLVDGALERVEGTVRGACYGGGGLGSVNALALRGIVALLEEERRHTVGVLASQIKWSLAEREDLLRRAEAADSKLDDALRTLKKADAERADLKKQLKSARGKLANAAKRTPAKKA
jgi:hypothetical protein